MPITDLANYKSLLGTPPEILDITCGALTVIAGRSYDLWASSLPAGVAPTAAVVPTNATTGAMGQQNGGTGELGIIGARFNAVNAGSYMLCDRLAHSGGLSGTVATAQTTNLPTPSLTRYTSGEGVRVGITIYTQIGTTAATVTVTYTDQDGNGSQVSPTVAIGATGFREAGRMIMIPLAVGDTGVRSVESVTLNVTTGTAGNFGVTLFKPLYTIIASDISGVVQGGFITGNTVGGIPEIVDNACLFPICISAGTSSAGCGALRIAEY